MIREIIATVLTIQLVLPLLRDLIVIRPTRSIKRTALELVVGSFERGLGQKAHVN